MNNQIVCEDWNCTMDIPDEYIGLEEFLQACREKQGRVVRWRWLKDSSYGQWMADQSYCYVQVRGTVYRLMGSLADRSQYAGPGGLFRKWLYQGIRRHGVFIPGAFEALSVF